MTKASHKIKPTRPKNAFQKPLQADFKQLFKSLAKGIGHTAAGKWEDLGSDTAETLSSIGLTTTPQELAFLLIRRALTRSLFDLVGESASQLIADNKKDVELIVEQIDFSKAIEETALDLNFLDQPASIPVLVGAKTLLRQWFEVLGINSASSDAITSRLPSYFVYALNKEWRQNAKAYRPLIDALNTPFSKAGEKEWAWASYSAFLQRRTQEGVFDEPFSLSQIYIPLNAYYLKDPDRRAPHDDMERVTRQRKRFVVSLQNELEQWLQDPNPQDSMRVISGGPGSGKSSFARIFSARIANEGKFRVLFVPLHLIDPTKDLVEEVGRFVRDEGILPQNPLDPEFPEPNLVIFFDGLDELASQGKAAAETARGFVREVERTLERRNQHTAKMRVIISGRELVIQENESEFRRARQILTLLPYYQYNDRSARYGDVYEDPGGLLKRDLRQDWWRNYGALTGKRYRGLPKELSRDDLAEVTAQPLLNYLVALSFTREKLNFEKGINLNSIYADLVAAVHERGYEKNRRYVPIRHMKPEDFSRVLEEIGLAAWHGDGRTTTVKEIEDHCRASGLGVLLDVFQDGAKAGVTRLLAAFFFRQYGHRASGDPTFVFTHKSFGEYLAAKRIVRAIERVVREQENRERNPDGGWDEREALKHWAQICGPSAFSRYLHEFLLNEIALRSENDVLLWQQWLTKLFSYVLRYGMPMEQLQIASFREALFQSRNAEETLLVALNACARFTLKVSTIEQMDPAAFGAWFRRIQGQRTGPDSVLAARCLSYLDLAGAFLDIADFYGADFSYSNLSGIKAHYTCFGRASFIETNLSDAILNGANFEGAYLAKTDLRRAFLSGATLNADFRDANLSSAHLDNARFHTGNPKGIVANLERANLSGAKLDNVDLSGVKLDGAITERARTPAAKNNTERLVVRPGKKSEPSKDPDLV